MIRLLRLMQSYVLPNQDADAYSTEVKPIQELVDFRELC